MQLIIYNNKVKINEEGKIKDKDFKFLIRFREIRQLSLELPPLDFYVANIDVLGSRRWRI